MVLAADALRDQVAIGVVLVARRDAVGCGARVLVDVVDDIRRGHAVDRLRDPVAGGIVDVLEILGRQAVRVGAVRA